MTIIVRLLPPFLNAWRESLTIKDDCSICLETLNNNKEKNITTKECNHTFHLSCLNKWIQQNPSCPCCRCELKTKKKTWFSPSRTEYIR